MPQIIKPPKMKNVTMPKIHGAMARYSGGLVNAVPVSAQIAAAPRVNRAVFMLPNSEQAVLYAACLVSWS
jgi:hypothetical protein